MSIIEKALKRKSAADVPAAKPNRESEAERGPIDRGHDFLDSGDDPTQAIVAEAAVGADSESVFDAGTTGANTEGTNASLAHIGNTSASYVELPFNDLRTQGFLTPTVPRSRLAEEFRTIKRPLLKNIDGPGSQNIDRPNLIMVTSALQGDGKTFSSINLAISIAMEQDKTVLFVDADVVRATAGKTLGIPSDTPGLIDLLQEGSEIEPADVIMRTNMDKLRILPAGNASDKSTELLASGGMHDFMIELSHRYPDRVIVFDSPPLLLTTEAAVLASFMGQIVFVASADVTPQHAAQEALEQIGEDKMIGIVLNRASRRRSKLLGVGSYGYGYGYGGGYGYGAGREGSSSAEETPDT